MMAAGVLLASTYSSPAPAAWTLAGDSRVTNGYDDNIRLTVDNALASPILSGDLDARFVQTQGRYQLSISPRVVAWRYRDYDLFDRVDRSLNVNVRGIGERNQSDLSLSLLRDSTLTSELGSTGITEINLPHESLQLSLSRRIRSTERLTHGISLFGTADRYLGAEGSGLRDYNYARTAFDTAYRISAEFRFTAGASLGRLKIPGKLGLTSNTVAATIGFDKGVGERWRISGIYGPSLTRSSLGESRGSIYDLKTTHRAERFDWNLSLSREVVPTGRGVLSRRERFGFGIEREMTERLIFSFSAGWIESRDVVPDDFVPSVGFEPYSLRYADASAALRWVMAPTWTLSLSVGQARQDNQNDGTSADRGNVMLSASWNGRNRELR